MTTRVTSGPRSCRPPAPGWRDRLRAPLARLKPAGGAELRAIRYPDGFIPAVTTARFLNGKCDILVVGDSGARDGPYLTSLGKRVVQLDIAPQPAVANLVLQSIEDRTPFPDDSFDGVVLNEVLEHLYRDLAALVEIRRVLRSDGVLVVTVPYSRRQDRQDFHVRIHTPRTLHRLMATAGFEVEEEFERGLVTRIPQISVATRGMILMMQLALTRLGGASETEAVFAVNGLFERVERLLGSHRILRRLQRLPITYGVAVKARPATPVSADRVQISSFQRTNSPPSAGDGRGRDEDR